MEQGLYAKVVKISRKGLKFIAENKNKNEAEFKFQGRSARSQRWFDLDFHWIEVNFTTRETDLYKKRFQSHDDTQDINTFKLFQSPIVNSKGGGNFKFHNDSPMLKYFQKYFNSCYFSSLASSFDSIKQTKADNDISLSIEQSLKTKVGNRIDFANSILKNKNENKNKREPRVYYSLRRNKKKGSYYILIDVSEHVTLVQ